MNTAKFVGILLIAIYILLPWIPINGHPAVFLDIENRRFHLLGLTLLVQDVWLLFYVISGLGLPAEMEAYTLNGCAPQFALWSFVDLGYLTYQVSYALATGKIASGTITSKPQDIPTTSAPRALSIRYSALVSRFGPGTATKTPL